MYNSSIKGQSENISFKEFKEIPNEVFFNDMSKQYMREAFKTCDVIFSEISWNYGYSKFNSYANNVPAPYYDYLNNIQKCILELEIPAFIVAGKLMAKKFDKAISFPIKINISRTNINGCILYVWNYNYIENFTGTDELTDFLAIKFKKCLDFSCGYGEHLMKFKDFVACDINKNCITYLSILKEEREKKGMLKKVAEQNLTLKDKCRCK